MAISTIGAYVDALGLQTHYVQKGTGPAVILLHGQSPGACVSVVWGLTLDPMAAAGYAMYAFEGPGFGRTDNPQDFTMATRIAHARAFIDAMGLERFSLWGHSDGSYIAASIALQDERVERLVLMASGALSPRSSDESPEHNRREAELRMSYTPSLENARATLVHSLVDQSTLDDELVQAFYEASSGKNHEAFRRRYSDRNTPPIYEELHRLKVPTLLLWGANDSGGPRRGLLLQEKIPGAELHIFDRCGHWVQRDQRDRVNRIVSDFLRGE